MKTIVSFLFLILVISSCSPTEKFYKGARGEGRVHEMSLLQMLNYLQKYLFTPGGAGEPDYLQALTADSAKKSYKNQAANFLPDTTLLFAGDIMWTKGEPVGLSPGVQNLIHASNGLVANLETPLTTSKNYFDWLPDLVKYNANPAIILKPFEGLLAALSIANNHSLDGGDFAAMETRQHLHQKNIPFSGVHEPGEKLWTTFRRQNILFGFYAATFGLNDSFAKTNLHINTLPGSAKDQAPQLNEIQTVLQQMELAKVDVKIISLHWGHEFEFYPEPAQMQTAQKISQWGADIIVGSHPHVAQPMQVIQTQNKKTLVLYSLGNFVTAMVPDYTRIGPVVSVGFKPQGHRVRWGDVSTQFIYNQAPSLEGGRQLVLVSELEQVCESKKLWGPPCRRDLIRLAQQAQGVIDAGN